ncbi:hypothetical protein GW17_00024310 [Ensete ventricosum]|nr:hypothetical protein GW17_00024310 [Ensete ventricosum]RZS18095.1 hypothetical protein BHM03_00050320 [Ensete ventricosum]
MCRGSSWDDEFLTTIVELYIVIEESTWLSFVCVCKLVRINREALRSRKRLIGPTRGRASDSFSRSVERSCTNASSGWGALCSPPDDQVNASIEALCIYDEFELSAWVAKDGGGCPSSTAPALAQPIAISSSPPKVQEIPSEEVTKKVTVASGKHLIEATSSQRKKAKVIGRHKSHKKREGSKSQAVKGKGPTSPVDEVLTLRARPKSVRELCNARPRVDDRDYHVIRVSSLPEHDPNAPLEMHLSPLTHGIQIWQHEATLVKYAWEVQIPQLATDLYTLSSEVLTTKPQKLWCWVLYLTRHVSEVMRHGSSRDDGLFTTTMELYVVVEESMWLGSARVCKLVRISSSFSGSTERSYIEASLRRPLRPGRRSRGRRKGATFGGMASWVLSNCCGLRPLPASFPRPNSGLLIAASLKPLKRRPLFSRAVGLGGRREWALRVSAPLQVAPLEDETESGEGSGEPSLKGSDGKGETFDPGMPPPFGLAEIRAAIPKHCWVKDPWRSMSYVLSEKLYRSLDSSTRKLRFTLPFPMFAYPFYLEWSYLRGGLTTLDRDYGWLNNIHHDIGTHVVHHLFPQIPHYHLVEAVSTTYFLLRFTWIYSMEFLIELPLSYQTEAAKPVVGKYYREPAKSGPLPLHLLGVLVRSLKHDHYVNDTGEVVYYQTDSRLRGASD